MNLIKEILDGIIKKLYDAANIQQKYLPVPYLLFQ